MTKRLLHYLSTFILSINLIGQTNASTADRWFSIKPTLKSDSDAIYKSGHKKIDVYELYINDSIGFDKKLMLTWSLQYRDKKITSTVQAKYNIWKIDLNNQTFKSHKIIEKVGAPCESYALTHFLDQSGQVVKTENKCVDCKCESSYHNFDWAEYIYNDGLLREITFYSKNHYSTKNLAYAKLVFDYHN